MSRRVSRLALGGFGLVGLVGLLALPGIANAHWDAPGPPSIRVSVLLDRVTLYSQFPDDGIDNNAELVLTWTANQSPIHPGSQIGSLTNDALGCQALPCDWNVVPPQVLYGHDECTPMARINLGFKLIEDDTDAWQKIAEDIGHIAEYVGQFPTGPIAEAANFIATILLLVSLNGDDEWGEGATVVDTTGTRISRIFGEEGREATLQYRTTTAVIDGDPCSVPPRPERPPVPTGDGRVVILSKYDAWRSLLTQALLVQPEPGNPGALTPAELDEDRLTVWNFVYESMDKLTEGAVQSIAHLPEHAQAQAELDQARALPRTPGFEDQAVHHYRNAATTAVDALIQSFVGVPPSLPDRGLALSLPVPNPGGPGLALTWRAVAGETVRLWLVSTSGRRTLLATSTSGGGTVRLDDPSLATGLYWVVLASERGTVARKIVWMGGPRGGSR
jgi:hypothetical protein